MNICILKESLDIGGTERSTANISKVLVDKHNVLLALYDASKIKYSYAGQLIDLNLPPKRTVIGKIINTYRRDIKLRKLIKSANVDVLFTFTGVGNPQTQSKYKAVKIISARDFGGMFKKYFSYKRALNNSAAMICNSEYTKQFYLSKYPEDLKKVFSLYNYIDIAEIKAQATEEVDDDFLNFINSHSENIVSVGRFCEEKGFEHLLEAFALLRQTNKGIGLVLVGDGSDKEHYLKAIERLGIQDHIYFTGYQNNPYKFMVRCDCFVLSSLSEGFPNVLAEAMALGLPVVATNCYSGPAEILRKDSNYSAVTNSLVECDYGILTPRITADTYENARLQMALAIKLLIENPNKMSHYGQMSVQRACEFSAEATEKKLSEILANLTKR